MIANNTEKHPALTFEDVEKAAFEIVRGGKERPSQRDVIAFLGRGSEVTVSRMLRDWYRKNLHPGQIGQADIPEPVEKQIKQLWKIALKNAGQIEAKQFEADKSEFKTVRQQDADKISSLNQQCTKQQQTIRSNAENISSLKQKLSEEKVTNDKMTERHQNLSGEHDELKQKHAALEASLLSLQEFSQVKIASQEKQHQEMKVMLEKQHACQVTALNKAIEVNAQHYRQDIDAKQQKILQLAKQKTTLQDELGQQQQINAQHKIQHSNFVDAQQKAEQRTTELNNKLEQQSKTVAQLSTENQLEKDKAALLSQNVQHADQTIKSLEKQISSSEKRFHELQIVMQEWVRQSAAKETKSP
jgi:chromosome segregation ATPase